MSDDLLSSFRRLMDHLNLDDPEEMLEFFLLLNGLGEHEMVAELYPRLLAVSAPVQLRLLIAEAAYYHPNPGWMDYLSRMLRREADLEVFDVGVRAMMRIGTRAAGEELQKLADMIHDPSRRELIAEALHASDPAKAFDHHLNNLFLGSSNPGLANQAAAELRRIAGPEHLESLLVVVYHQDMLVSRHALKLIAGIQSLEAAHFLKAYLLECHQDILDDRVLKDLIGTLKPLSGSELWSALLQKSSELFETLGRTELTKLQSEGPGSGEVGLRALETLRPWARGNLENFLLDAIALILNGKASRLSNHYTEGVAGLQGRARRAPYALDTCAAGLDGLVRNGLVVREEVVPLLLLAFNTQTGRESNAKALGNLVLPGDPDALESILSCGDVALRANALEAVGQRHDPAFLDFILRACHDAIEDIASKMIFTLEGLSGLEERIIALIEAKNIEDVTLGLRIVRMNHLSTLAESVLAFLESNPREELAVDAVLTLGELGTKDPVLLEKIHSGQSATMIQTLAQALAGRAAETTAIQLGQRVKGLRDAEAWMTAAEGLIHAWSSQGSMSSTASELFVDLVKAAWEEKSTLNWRLRIANVIQGTTAVPGLRSEDIHHYEVLFGMISTFWEDKRLLHGWSLDQQSQLASVLRYLKQGMDAVKGGT